MKPRMTLRWIVFGLAAFVMNFPILATLITAFKSPAEVSRNPSLWIEAPSLENFATVLTVSDRLNIYHYLWNSTVAALIGAVLPMIVAFPLAWAMVRRGVGRGVLFPLVVNLRALPLIIFAIPLYMMYSVMGLLDTRLGLGLILAVVNLPLTLMLLVNAVAEIPARSKRPPIWTAHGCPPSLAGGAAAVPAGADHHLHLRLHHRLERVPVRPDADHARSGSDDRGRFVLLRHLGRRGAMGGGGGSHGGGCAAAACAGMVMYRRISGSMVAGAVKG